MVGYNPEFLGTDFPLPMPSFSPTLVGNVLRKPELRDDIYVDYINFTVIMNRVRRSPLVTALNIDQNLLKKVQRKRGWDIDTRVGRKYQLDNDYYANNYWDRGHLARRANAAWGNSKQEARRASDATFFFTNAALQHENFNQDEWLALENWVRNLTLDQNGLITEFTGPIYGGFDRRVTPSGRQPAEVPSGFFKIVCFINGQTQELDVRAFIMWQDADALADKRGKELFNFQRYQVTVSEIEELTGLFFDDKIYEKNPLLFNENEEAKEKLHIDSFPECIPVDEAEEMISQETQRQDIGEELPVYIAAAMVNPKGDERQNEWVSVINLCPYEIDLTGWTLSDMKRIPLQLDTVLAGEQRILKPGEARQIKPLNPLALSNQGGTIALYQPMEGSEKGLRIDRVHYTQKQASVEGVPIVFSYTRDN